MTPDPVRQFEDLATRACQETLLQSVDVADRVVKTLQARPMAHRAVEPEMLVLAGGALASATAAVAYVWIQASLDQFLPLFEPFGTLLP